MTVSPIRVTVWNEYLHEVSDPRVRAVYPDGIHGAIAAGLQETLGDAVTVRTATLDQPEHGLTEAVLAETDVLTWWGHQGHERVADAIVDRVQARVLEGMGLLVLHSGHFSKIFKRLMGTGCGLRWREAEDRELVWTVNPGHPIARGVPSPISLDRQEMYGEYFDIPRPDELIFISSFSGGEVFRSGCTFTRGLGRIFYFSPGHESFPIYRHTDVQRVIANGVQWAATRPEPGYRAFSADNAPTGWFERDR